VFEVGLDRLFHHGWNTICNRLVLELAQVIPDWVVLIKGLLDGVTNQEIDNITVISSEGEGSLVQKT
jgi:hypothetical protein